MAGPNPTPLYTIASSDGQNLVEPADVVPWLCGYLAQEGGPIELPDLDLKITIPEIIDTEFFDVELPHIEGLSSPSAFSLPGSWVIPWVYGRAAWEGYDAAEFDPTEAPRRQRRMELLMSASSRGIVIYRGFSETRTPQ